MFDLDTRKRNTKLILTTSKNILYKINPNHAAANYDYGLALTNIKDFEKAKEHALKALELTPSGPDRERYLQGGLWLIHIGLKDFDEAIKSMEYMLEKNILLPL